MCEEDVYVNASLAKQYAERYKAICERNKEMYRKAVNEQEISGLFEAIFQDERNAGFAMGGIKTYRDLIARLENFAAWYD